MIIHNLTANMLEMAKDNEDITIAIRINHAWYFDWHICIWLRRILQITGKPSHTSTAKILEIVKDKVKD